MRSFTQVSGATANQQRSLTVVTYNVLANKFALSGKHDYCGREFLEWGGRGSRIMEEILAYSADILCLQEVEKDMYTQHWEPMFQLCGYEGIYFSRASQQRQGATESVEVVEGCALLYRASKFICRDIMTRRFADLIPASAPGTKFMNKVRSLNEGAAIAVLACRGCGTELVAASTHIHWDPKWPEIKAFQTSLLTQMVSEAAQGEALTHVIIGGDFNSLWRKHFSDEFDSLADGEKFIVSGAYELMAEGELSPDHPHHPNQRHTGLPPLPLTSHTLSLTSAHYKGAGREPPMTTKTDRFAGCLDYIFVSDTCEIVGLLEMPYGEQPDASDPKGSNVEFGPLPNSEFGSDHLAVGCQLRLCRPDGKACFGSAADEVGH